MIDPNNFIIHFGCRGGPGHYLTTPSKHDVRDFEADRINIPRAHEYDGSAAFLPFPEAVGVGALTYLPANNRIILAWWDRTFDGRPGCNMAVITPGCLPFDVLWEKFQASFPDLAQVPKPNIVRRNLRITADGDLV